MGTGEAYQMRVSRAENRLRRDKLIVKTRAGWEITDKGEKELKRL
jgi:Mn-dependent DtxR family transcriptional regulator